MHRNCLTVTAAQRMCRRNSAIVHADLLDRYNALCMLREIRQDPDQIRVVMQLRRLTKQLKDYEPTHISYIQPVTDEATVVNPEVKALIKSMDLSNEMLNLSSPKGALITGPPGTGKTFLADAWFSSLPTASKTRRHYNQFVLDLYRGVWEVTTARMRTGLVDPFTPEISWTKNIRDQVRRMPDFWDRLRKPTTSEMIIPIPYILASRLIRSSYVLLIDEVQLQDVSSALLMSDVLVWYWRMGGVVVGTSNRVPEDLYVNGVQRERLGAFGSALRVRCPVVELGKREDAQDYRLLKGSVPGRKTWFLSNEKTEFSTAVLAKLGDGILATRELSVFGRRLTVRSSGTSCILSFDELCEESLGSADYLTLSSTFRCIFITDLRVIRLPSEKNQARRLISLIDALYEARCQIFCLASTSLEDLFMEDGDNSSENADSLFQESVSVSEGGERYRPNVSLYTKDDAQPEQQILAPLETLSIFSGKDEQFAFKRAYSRLAEMTSPGYQAEWTPLLEEIRAWERGSQTAASNKHSSFLETQPLAPKLSDNHVWGVREDWGGGGRWGRGASAYEKR